MTERQTADKSTGSQPGANRAGAACGRCHWRFCGCTLDGTLRAQKGLSAGLFPVLHARVVSPALRPQPGCARLWEILELYVPPTVNLLVVTEWRLTAKQMSVSAF